MPRVTRAPLLAAAFAALTIAACSSGTAPGWTYDPTTPAPTASAAPASAAPTTLPSDAASEAPSASADGGGSGGDVVTLDAMGIQWMEKELSGPADEQFTVRFNNQDAGTPHNVEIKQNGASLFRGDIINGVATKDYTVGPFAAGTYEYVCTVHPNMVGTLTTGG